MLQNTVLVINCGSSSLKFSLINPQTNALLFSGIAERLLSSQAFIKITVNDNKQQHNLPAPFDHQSALSCLVDFMLEHKFEQQLLAVGHRVVHGGEHYSEPTLITEDVKATISDLAKLAPLHNPVNLIGINAAEIAFSHLPQVAIFDTAFHQTMPQKAFITGLPYRFYKEQGIRNYGFHGTSHYYVSNQAATLLNKPISESSFISAHLGNGCSITAIENGKSVDSSMGLTPLSGVVMGTRCGDIDPGIILHLMEQLNYSAEDVSKILNKESGLLGISGMSNDCRTLEQAIIDNNDLTANLAIDIFCYRIAKSIASFMASLTHLDGLIFTGGIGENSDLVRSRIVRSLHLLNIKLDADKNLLTRFGKSGVISTEHSANCLVIPTNEEQVIAEQTYQLIKVEK